MNHDRGLISISIEKNMKGRAMSKSELKKVRIAVVGREEDTKNYMRTLGHMDVDAICTMSLEEASLCDGLLLPGGGDMNPSRYNQPLAGSTEIDEPLDEVQFAACKMFVEKNKPVMGICKGAQVINVFFGGTLIQDLPNTTAHKSPDGKPIFHSSTAKEGGLIYELYGTDPRVNSIHHQAIDKLGEGLQAIQWAEDGTIEAIEHVEKPIIALQWHPERMCFEMATDEGVDGSKLFSYFVDSIALSKDR